MNKIRINQFVCTLDYGDAIGNEVLTIKHFLNNLGYESEIYMKNCHPKLSKICHFYKEYSNIKTDILIHHFSIGTDFDNYVNSLKNKKILIYHNITPAKYFSKINTDIEFMCAFGRNQLEKFKNNVTIALGDSEYSQKELVKFGFTNTGVLPIIIDFEIYRETPAQHILDKLNDGNTNLLFVGRLVPNKKHEDIIKIFYYYKKFIDKNARLFFIGSYKGLENYFEQLKMLIRKLELNDVYFTGKVNFNELLAYYKTAHVFISMSEHEGFCVPLLESIYFNIPIIAYNSTAIPYTLGNSGILVNDKNYIEIAEMINLLVKDVALRTKIIKKQNERFEDFDKHKIELELIKYIDNVSNPST